MNLVPFRTKTNRGRFATDTALTQLRDEMDDLFARFFGRGATDLAIPTLGTTPWGPRMDLVETAENVIVTAEVPGVNPKDIEINVTGNVMTVRGEKKQEREEKGQDYQYSERQFGAFHRNLQLPAAVDPDRVEAIYKDGILTITVAKHPEAQPKRIPVKAS